MSGRWRMPKIWQGGTCYVIGGGPSMPRQFGVPENLIQKVFNKQESPAAYSPYMSFLHDKHVIGVNMAFALGDWVDIMFFGDKKFFLGFRAEIAKFKNMRVTCNPRFSKDELKEEHIKVMLRNRKKQQGISTNIGMLSWNNNSGASAINLAYHTGATKIILLGFDMNRDGNNNQHWHKFYKGATTDKPENKLPFTRHLKAFPQIAKDAKKLGIDIINANPSSAIEVFEKIPLKQIIDEG